MVFVFRLLLLFIKILFFFHFLFYFCLLCSNSLHCSPCTSLNTERLFASVDLPRWKSVKLQGVSTCSENLIGAVGDLNDYHCTDRHEPSQCKSIPEWLVEHLAMPTKPVGSHCNMPSCDFFLDAFEDFDSSYQGAPDPDALLNEKELSLYLQVWPQEN